MRNWLMLITFLVIGFFGSFRMMDNPFLLIPFSLLALVYFIYIYSLEDDE